MKLNFKSIFAAFATLVAVSCTPSAIDELKGNYNAPTDLTLSKLDNMSIDKKEGYRFITVNLSGSDKAVIKFASKDYYLVDGTYYLNTEEGIKGGMYSKEASKVNGKAIQFGSINVTINSITGNDYNYTINGVVETGNNERVRLDWTGVITFEPDPEPVILTQVFSAQSNVASGTNSVTVSLASAGVSSSYDAATYSTTYSGSGNFASIDIYSADGYLHEGTYKPCATGGAINPGEYGIGWDPGDLWGIGYVFTNWGTCWWTVDGGQTSAQHIDKGEIVVSKKGSKWVIEYNNYDVNKIWFKFTGAIEALDEPAEEEVTWYKMVATKAADGSVTDENNTPVSGFDRWDVQLVSGESVVAAFDLVVKSGSDIAGDYEVKAYPHEDHVAGNGWGIAAWNYYGGTRIASGSDWLYVSVGSLFTVTKTAEGTYKFTSRDMKYENSATGEQTTGNLALGGTTGDVPQPTPVYTMTATKAADGSVTDENNTPVSGFDRYDVQLLSGETVMAAFDLVVKTGDDFTGSYTVKAYPHEDHVAGNGWGIAAWNYYGGTRISVDGTFHYVNVGSEFTVTKGADGVYTFKGTGCEMQSSADGSTPYTADFTLKGEIAG